MSSRYKAKVIRVFDGDTIEIEIKKGSKKTIRFFGIDTPERTQKFGKEARDRVKELIHQKEVEIFPVELGRYGREVGVVYLNGSSISELLLKEGFAFASGNNHKLATQYHRLQEISRANKTGMWKLGFIENPAVYRKRKQSLFKKAFVLPNKNKENKIVDIEKEDSINKEIKKESKSLLQHLKDLIGDTYKDITKEDKYISGNEILKRINKKPKV